MQINYGKKLRELSEEEKSKYKELGTATGTLGVCFHMASKYTPNFLERVVGFCVKKDESAEMFKNSLKEFGLGNGEEIISVTFYE
jgi:hypothetical protein